MKIVRLKEIAERLLIPWLEDDGKTKITKTVLRETIAKFLLNPGSQFVSKRVKCVVGGEELEGVVLSVAESADESAGEMIYAVKFDNGIVKGFFLHDLSRVT